MCSINVFNLVVVNVYQFQPRLAWVCLGVAGCKQRYGKRHKINVDYTTHKRLRFYADLMEFRFVDFFAQFLRLCSSGLTFHSLLYV